jgi:hypothetical protein
VTAPLARTIPYNAAGPISALGFKSTTLTQLMSRYATSDPNLISSTSTTRIPLIYDEILMTFFDFVIDHISSMTNSQISS